MQNTEKMLKVLTELCDEIVSDAFVVTDGRRVCATVLDYDLGVKLAKLANSRSSEQWYVLNIPTAINTAFEFGYHTAKHEKDGENDGKDSELRKCQLPEQEKTD